MEKKRRIITATGTILQRDTKYKVGKRIGNSIYFHKDYLNQIPIPKKIKSQLSKLENKDRFNIIRVDFSQNNFSLMMVPDFNDS